MVQERQLLAELRTKLERFYSEIGRPSIDPELLIRGSSLATATVDPCSAWTAKANKRVQFGYRLNYLIDIECAVIVDVQAIPARTYDEAAAAKTMIARTEERLGLKPNRLTADTAYGTGKFLGWLVGNDITPHIPVWDKSQREDGTFSRSDFTFDKERNVYVCPAGKLLTTTDTVGSDHTLRYLALKRDCNACPLKPQCCPNIPSRKVTRDVDEDARDVGRALMGTPEFDKSRDERKKVEMRFAHLKTHHGFQRMRLRGLSGARDWREPDSTSIGANEWRVRIRHVNRRQDFHVQGIENAFALVRSLLAEENGGSTEALS